MFLNYYLPMAEKFAREYEQLLGYEDSGENMESLKRDITQGVGELAEAFEQIAIRMCDKMEINIFQDITVLEVLMAQNSRKGAEKDEQKKKNSLYSRDDSGSSSDDRKWNAGRSGIYVPCRE